MLLSIGKEITEAALLRGREMLRQSSTWMLAESYRVVVYSATPNRLRCDYGSGVQGSAKTKVTKRDRALFIKIFPFPLILPKTSGAVPPWKELKVALGGRGTIARPSANCDQSIGTGRSHLPGVLNELLVLAAKWAFLAMFG